MNEKLRKGGIETAKFVGYPTSLILLSAAFAAIITYGFMEEGDFMDTYGFYKDTLEPGIVEHPVISLGLWTSVWAIMRGGEHLKSLER